MHGNIYLFVTDSETNLTSLSYVVLNLFETASSALDFSQSSFASWWLHRSWTKYYHCVEIPY